jgi:putative methionine-R-sulfoxide reductase with GAF domain
VVAPGSPSPIEHSPNALPDWGIAALVEFLQHYPGGPLGVVVSLFVVLYLVIILVRLIQGDEVEFLGLFKTSRRMKEARQTIGDLGLLLRGNGILFKSIESTLRRIDAIRVQNSDISRDDALRYLCEWIPKGITYGTSDANKLVVFVPNGDSLVVRAHSGLSPEAIKGIVLPIQPRNTTNDTFAAMAFRFGEPFVSRNVANDPRYHALRGYAPSHPYVSVMAIPIRRNGTVVGVYTIDSQREGRFGNDQVRFGELFAWLFGELL